MAPRRMETSYDQPRMIEEWERIVGRPAPPLVHGFALDADAALDALLSGRVGSSLAQRGSAGVLGAWLSPLPADSEFARVVDGALARRIHIEWRRRPAQEGVLGRRRALMLMRLFDIVAVAPGLLPDSAQELRELFEEHEESLEPWSPAPSQDPMGRYLLAIARTQADRSLAPEWFTMCQLPATMPPFRAEYAIAGLRGLPRSVGVLDDEFPYEVAAGLRLLADGIGTAIAAERIGGSEGRQLLVGIAQVAIAAYPLGGWSAELLLDIDGTAAGTAALLRELARLDERAVTEEALRRMLGRPQRAVTATPNRDTSRAPGRLERPQGDATIDAALQRLRTSDPEALRRMQELLDHEVAQAERSGNFGWRLGGLYRRASTAARSGFPEAAVTWGEEARRWEPWDVRSWTVLTSALRSAGRHTVALDRAWRAQGRFSYNPYVWTELGKALAARNHVVSAEAVLEEAMRVFPEDPYLVSVYGEVLVDTGRAAAAVELLREATDRFRGVAATAPHLWNVLTAALVGAGRTGDALRTAEEAALLLPDNPTAQRTATHFDAFRKERERRDKAYQTEPEAAPEEADATLFAIVSEARILRQWARAKSDAGALLQADSLLRGSNSRGRTDPKFVAERALVAVDQGEADQALNELKASSFTDGTDPSIALAITRAKRVALRERASQYGRDAMSLYEPGLLRTLSLEMREAAQSNPALQPLSWVVNLHAAAGLTDGAALNVEREELYAKVMGWVTRIRESAIEASEESATHEEVQFLRSWSAALGGVWNDLGAAPGGAAIADRTVRRSRELDGIEEQFERRLAALA